MLYYIISLDGVIDPSNSNKHLNLWVNHNHAPPTRDQGHKGDPSYTQSNKSFEWWEAKVNAKASGNLDYDYDEGISQMP